MIYNSILEVILFLVPQFEGLNIEVKETIVVVLSIMFYVIFIRFLYKTFIYNFFVKRKKNKSKGD